MNQANDNGSQTNFECECVNPSPDDTTQTEAELNAEIATLKPWTKKTFRAYCGKLRLLSSIHREVANKINTLRENKLQMFHGQDDKYYPEYGESLVDLMLETMRTPDTQPSDPPQA